MALHTRLLTLDCLCCLSSRRVRAQEYVPGGELFAHLKASSNHHFSEKRTRFYIAEAVLALQHMHEKEHLVYRDIKPENMLLDENGHLKVRLYAVSLFCMFLYLR